MKITPLDESKNLLQKAKVTLVLQHPFFGVLACHLPTVPVGADVFAAVGVNPPTAMVDGKKIYYYPPFVESLTEKQRLGLMAHEVMHPALNHLWRRNNRRPDLWMRATDYAINEIILRTKNERGEPAFELPPNGLYDPKYAGMAAEQIYAILMQDEAAEEEKDKKGKSGKAGKKDKSQERICGGQLEKPLEGDDEKREREQKRKEQQKKMEEAREKAEKKEAAEKAQPKKAQPQKDEGAGEDEEGEEGDEAGEKPEDAEGVEGEDGFDGEGEGEEGEGEEGEDGDEEGDAGDAEGDGQAEAQGGDGKGSGKGSGGGGEQEEEGEGEGEGGDEEGEEGEGQHNQQAAGHGGCCSHDEGEMNDADGTLDEQWKELLNQAAMTAKARGKLPGHLDRLVSEVTNPKVPWQQIIEQYVNDVVRDDYDMLKQDRRFMSQGIYFPELQSNSTKVGIVVDTSGSIGEVEIKAFVGEITGILRCRGVSAARIMACDAAVTLDVTIAPTDPLPENYPGGGGTDFRPPFKRFLEDVEGTPPSLIVYLTDMCGTFPDKDPGIPTIWLANCPPYMKFDSLPKPSFGTVVPYEALTEDAAVTVNSF